MNAILTQIKPKVGDYSASLVSFFSTVPFRLLFKDLLQRTYFLNGSLCSEFTYHWVFSSHLLKLWQIQEILQKKNCTKERQQIKQNKDKTLSYPKSTTFTCVYKSGIQHVQISKYFYFKAMKETFYKYFHKNHTIIIIIFTSSLFTLCSFAVLPFATLFAIHTYMIYINI